MNISVTKDNVVIIEDSNLPHENEYKITKCYFTFDTFTEPFQVKRAIFTILSTGEMYETDIVNNECYVPVDVLKHELETIKIGVYSFDIETIEEDGKEKEILKQRTSPSYTTFVVPSGSYEEGALSPEIITPSQYDIYSQALQEGLEEVSCVDIDASKSGRTATITITNRNNEEKSVQVSDGISIENMEIEDNHLWVTYNEPTEPQDLGQVVPIKGQDYFTTAEIEEMEGTVKEQVKTDLDFNNTVARIDSDIQDLNSNKASKTELEQEQSARKLADTNLQGQIDAITSSKDVVDIVGTYQDLMNYDTTSLTEDDVIKVLDDSTHNDAMSYYRWSNNTWNYVGSEGPFYTRSETDERLNTKQPTIDSAHKLSSDLVDDINQTNKFTSTNEKNTWNAKYDKPNTGIPKSDLVESVQESLDKADSAIQDVSDKEDKSNKVTEINSSSTDTQYPSAKCVYDSQEEQNEQIAELEMLYNAFPTVSDEDTTIQLDNTAKVKFREIDLKGNTSQVVIPEEQGTSVSNTSIYVSDVDTDKEHTIEMSGNTYQETTTGKNLLNTNNIATGTLSGITTSYNAETQEITLNGTCTTDNTQILISTNAIDFTSGVTKMIAYYVSGSVDVSSTTDNRLLFRTFRGGGQWDLYAGVNIATLNSSNPIVSITGGSTGTKSRTDFRIDKNTVLTDFKIKLMITDSDNTDFEKFTYGASPNPDYPQNIEVVTGTQNVEVCGKNLFDGILEIGNFNSNTGEKIANNDYIINTNPIPVEELTNYKISSNGTGIRMYVFEYKEDMTYNLSTRKKVNDNEYLTTNSGTKYINFRTVDANTNLQEKIQVEKGTTATTYEAYTGTTYPINLGNIELCKIDTYQDRIYKSNDKWYLEKKIGKVVLDGTQDLSAAGTNTTGYYRFNIDIGTNIYTTDTVTVKAPFYCNKLLGVTRGNTYARVEGVAPGSTSYSYKSFNIYIEAISQMTALQAKSWLSQNNVIVYYPYATPTTTEITDTTLVSQLNALYNATIYPITNINTETSNLLPYIDLHYNFVTPSPSPSRPSVVNVVKGNNTITISNSDNTESQNYPINLGDIELCKIGTYQDYIYESNGNWYLEKNIDKKFENSFTGIIAVTSTLADNLYGYACKTQGISSYSELGAIISNIFVPKILGSQTDTTNPNNVRFNMGIAKHTNTNQVVITIDKKYLKTGTTTEFSNFLNNNNFEYYCVLATPTDTQITDTTLINQLNNIKKAYSYDTQTNISQTNTDKPFIIYAEAIRSLKDVFE